MQAVTRDKQCCEIQANASRDNSIPESTFHDWIRDERLYTHMHHECSFIVLYICDECHQSNMAVTF